MDGLAELLEGIETSSYPGWASNVTSSTPGLTAENLIKLRKAIEDHQVPIFRYIMPRPARGMTQRARRLRRVRLATGAILELPDGANPVIYLLTNGAQWR